MPHFKDKPFRSVISKKLSNINQLKLPLTSRKKPQPKQTPTAPPAVIILPPASTYDDPEFVRRAIECVRLENRSKGRKNKGLSLQARYW